MALFQGYVDGIHSDEAIGWAINLSQVNTPTVVSIFLNGCPYTRTLACHHRADVADVYGTSGMHGFRVLLPTRGTAETVEVTASFENGKQLGNGILHYRIPENQDASTAPPDGPCLLFMHIQKTA